MALWRDPLDDLIDELDRLTPPEIATPIQTLRPPLADLQWAVSLLLDARTDEERAEAARVAADIFQPDYRSRF